MSDAEEKETTYNPEDIFVLSEHFSGKVFSNQREMYKWLMLTKKIPTHIQFGEIQGVGVQGWVCKYE